MRKSDLLLILLFVITLQNNMYSQWHHYKGLYGGRVNRLMNKDNKIFAGTINGVYLSTDNGTNWIQINDGLPPNVGITDLVSNGENIYAATSEYGVYLSSNNGTNWVAVNNGLTGYQRKIVNTLTVSGNNIYAGMNGTAGGGVYLSSDNGNSWTARNNGLPSGMHVTGFAVNGDNIYVCGWDGIFISTNNGTTWTAVNNGLANLSVYSITTDGNSIFAIVGNVHGIYISTDNGSNWVFKDIGLGGHLADRIYVSGKNIYVLASDVYLSTDGGNNFNKIINGKIFGGFWQFTTDICVVGNNLFVATANGIFVSINNGTKWGDLIAYNNGLDCVEVNTIAINGDIIAVSGDNTNLFLSNDSGLTWKNIDIGYPTITALLINDSKIIAGTWMGDIYLSSDNGVTWMRSFRGMGTIRALISKGDSLFAGAGAPFLSTNNGINWTLINNGVENMYASTDLTVSGDNIYISVYFIENSKIKYKVYKSTNNGANWVSVDGISVDGIYSLAINGNNLYLGTAVGVYITANDGMFWAFTNNGIPSDVFGKKSISVIKSIGNNIFAGTYGGLYSSTNSASNNTSPWLPVKGGLKGQINSLKIYDNRIYVGTNNGLYSASIQYLTAVENEQDNLPVNYILYQNYPNPFNPTTTIDYSIPTTSFVTIAVYDILGREVTKLVNEEKQPGNYSILFDGSNFPSSIYFYRIQAGNFVETKKLILLK